MHPVSLVALLAASASAAVAPRQNSSSSSVNQNVIPKSFGITAGQGKDEVQPGACTGANKKPIPCYCPPAPTDPDFLSKLTQALTKGFIFSKEQVAIPITLDKFNDESDKSVGTQKLRATAMIQVMQNFNMTTQGVGCPGVAVPVLSKMQQTGQISEDTSGVGNAGK
jgi:hypothetical protein